jgi:uncharacterized membrane protein HdeD (DUF308 family)
VADDNEKMKELESLAELGNAKAEAPKIATGVGSGPRRRSAAFDSIYTTAALSRVYETPNLMVTWIITIFGFFFIFLSLIFHFISFREFDIRSVAKQFLSLKFPYLLTAIGFFGLGISRGRTRRTYEIQKRQQKSNSLNAWKIPLISFQELLLFLIAIYAMGVGLSLWFRIQNLGLMVGFLILFLAYTVWYLISYFKNRFGGHGAYRIAALALVLSAIAFFSNSLLSIPIISLIIGLYAVLTGVISAFTPIEEESTHVNLLRMICLFGSMIFLFPIAVENFPSSSNQVPISNIGQVLKGLSGKIGYITYAPDGHELAFVQKNRKTWGLNLIKSHSKHIRAFKIKSPMMMHPIFVDEGRAILVDPGVSNDRQLLLINVKNGMEHVLVHKNVLPFQGQQSYFPHKNKFLYITRNYGFSYLNSINLNSFRKKLISRSFANLKSPAWIQNGKQILFVANYQSISTIEKFNPQFQTYAVLLTSFFHHLKIHHVYYVHQQEWGAQLKHWATVNKKKHKFFQISEVIPSQNVNRYLFLVASKNSTSFWIFNPLKSSARKVKEIPMKVTAVQLFPDTQKAVFQASTQGFFKKKYVGILNLNLSTVKMIVPSQLPSSAPALSPDGFKVAFASQQGLWYPLGGRQSICAVALH